MIRNGVRAIYSSRSELEEVEQAERTQNGWTAYSFAHEKLWQILNQRSQDYEFKEGDAARNEASLKFYEYAYQWY